MPPRIVGTTIYFDFEAFDEETVAACHVASNAEQPGGACGIVGESCPNSSAGDGTFQVRLNGGSATTAVTTAS